MNYWRNFLDGFLACLLIGLYWQPIKEILKIKYGDKMNWFKRKEKCAVVGCETHKVKIFGEPILKELQFEFNFIKVCVNHYNALTQIIIADQSKFAKESKLQSDIDHILWLMDKFPIEDFEASQNLLSVYGFTEDAFWFKGKKLYSVVTGLFFNSEDLKNFYKIKEKYNKLCAEFDEKTKKEKEAQRKQVLDEMADERIARNIKVTSSLDGRTIIIEENVTDEELKEIFEKPVVMHTKVPGFDDNKSIKKAYKRKAKGKKK